MGNCMWNVDVFIARSAFLANFPPLWIERGFRQRQKLINDGFTLYKKITPEETEDKVV